MKGKKQQAAEKFVFRQLAIGRNRDDIIAHLCEAYAMDWDNAEALLTELEAGKGSILSTTGMVFAMMAMGAILLGGLFLGVYILLSLALRHRVNKDIAIVLLLAGITLFAVALIIYSRNENKVKDEYRCPHCSYLANRLGRENPIFFPRYEASTYFTQNKLLSTRTVGGPSDQNDYNIYRKFEVYEICRQCFKVRRKSILERKITVHRDSQHNWPYH